MMLSYLILLDGTFSTHLGSLQSNVKPLRIESAPSSFKAMVTLTNLDVLLTSEARMERQIDVQIGAAAAVICRCFGRAKEDLLVNLYSYPHIWPCPKDARYRRLKGISMIAIG